MQRTDDAHPWFNPTLSGISPEPGDDLLEFERLWRGFMTARVTLGLVLLLLQATLFRLGMTSDLELVVICGIYLAAALPVRLVLRPRRLGRTFDPLWLFTIGADVVVFAALQFLQGNSINYTPLLALPVLLAAVLGSLTLALGTAASITLLLLAHASWLSLHHFGDAAPYFIQAALTGVGSFVIAFLAHQLSARLAGQEKRAHRNQTAAHIQQQVNDLVIESLADGILVVDAQGTVHAANPAARAMLQTDSQPIQNAPFQLASNPVWQPLTQLTQAVFSGRDGHQADITVQQPGQGAHRLRVRTRLTAPQGGDAQSLCVMFLQDQREMEARLRTEKLASLGRMSAAVAHEIRNPLAAIVQANALLDEDLNEPRYKQLTQIVQQNAYRLEKIVEDILNVSRVQKNNPALDPQPLALNETVSRICHDWADQTQSQHMLRLNLSPAPMTVNFDPEHLRRVLVNLLDNARRYASGQAESIQVTSRLAARAQAVLGVWSDSPPMEPSVERHLFEPFFSSESRSSGLGLYICRELCEGHGASITHQRSLCTARGSPMEGNEFLINLRPSHAPSLAAATQSPLFTPWQ